MSELMNIETLKDGQTLSGSIVYLPSYTKKAYADGKKFYITGSVSTKTASIQFTVWDKDLVKAMDDTNISGYVVQVSGTVSTYQNALQLKIDGLVPVTETEKYPLSMFLKSLDVPKIYKEFTMFLNNNFGDTAIKALNLVFGGENLYERFKEEFAGSKMHDAVVGGLLNHTLKMLKLVQTLGMNDARLYALPHYKDLLYLGTVFHDIGKVYEMDMGVYTEVSFVTHRTLGVEMLCKYKEGLIALYDEHFFYHLLAIVQGHHGKEWGDAPTTVAALLIHNIDLLDARTTTVLDKIENNEVNNSGAGKAVYVDGGYLNI